MRLGGLGELLCSLAGLGGARSPSAFWCLLGKYLSLVVCAVIIYLQLGIAIPGSRDPESRDPGPFTNPEIPGLDGPNPGISG